MKNINREWSEMSMNKKDFEKIMIWLRDFPKGMDFSKKFRIIMEHDPDSVAVQFKSEIIYDSSKNSNSM